MSFTIRKFAILVCTFLAILGFSSSANATYYSFYSSYSSAYNYGSYNSGYRYYRSSYRWNRFYRWGYRGYYKQKKRRIDKKPVARSDRYTIDVGTRLVQNVITENDFQGDAPATVRILRGRLPNGVRLASDGRLSGTPSESGVFYVVYKLRDKDGDYATSAIKMVVEDNNLLPEAVDDSYSGDVGVALSQNVISENDTQGDGPATAMLLSGSLPGGVSLNDDGTLTGAPDAPGLFVANYKITDANGDMSSATITITVAGDLAYCPQAADGDELSNDETEGQALNILQISSGLRFVGAPTAIQTFPEGNLQVEGVLEDEADNVFEITLVFSGLQDSSASPLLTLNPSAYVGQGGSIDPDSWQFFDSVSGTVAGTSGPWAGVSFSVAGDNSQVGVGANGKNGNLGLYSALNLILTSASAPLPNGYNVGDQLHAEFNIDLADECPVQPQVVNQLCAVDAPLDSFGRYSDGHALEIRIPNLNRKYVFDPEGMVSVFDNGDLTITGNVTNGSSSFDVELKYSDFMDDTPGSPKRELIPSAYVDAGGPVDPSEWDFYGSVEGTLTGNSGDVDGVVLSAAPMGPIAQIGFGANGKNISFGLSNWFTFTVVSAPSSASVHVGQRFAGDANLDLNSDCLESENLLPEAVDDLFRIEVGGEQLDGNILTNDIDGDGQSVLSFDPQDLPEGVSLSANGDISGAPEQGVGEYVFNYTITDQNGDMSTATVFIFVTVGNTPG